MATVADRFWPKVDRRGPDECWPWTASTRAQGYGQFFFRGRPWVASRVVWILTHEAEIPGGFEVRHRCDNPRCVNPSHLELGTHRDNMHDAFVRGRNEQSSPFKTHCVNGHARTPDNIVLNQGKRVCRTCVLARGARVRERQRGKHRAYWAAYHVRNRERILARKRERRKAHAASVA